MNIPNTFELDQVCLIIDLEGFRSPTRWVERCVSMDGQRIDPHLWGRQSTFVVREFGWCAVLHPADTGSYKYDHALQKFELPTHVRRPMQYVPRIGLAPTRPGVG